MPNSRLQAKPVRCEVIIPPSLYREEPETIVVTEIDRAFLEEAASPELCEAYDAALAAFAKDGGENIAALALGKQAATINMKVAAFMLAQKKIPAYELLKQATPDSPVKVLNHQAAAYAPPINPVLQPHDHRLPPSAPFACTMASTKPSYITHLSTATAHPSTATALAIRPFARADGRAYACSRGSARRGLHWLVRVCRYCVRSLDAWRGAQGALAWLEEQVHAAFPLPARIVKCGYGVCNRAGTPREFNRCSACKSIHYCSTKCQKSDWPSHKLNCKKLKAEAAAL